MSNRAMLVSLLAAIMLGVVAAIALRGPAAGSAPVAPVELLGLPVAGVQSIEVVSGERRELATRSELGWMYEAGDDRWPIDEDRVLVTLRLLKSRTLMPGDAPLDAEPAGTIGVGGSAGSMDLTLWRERVGGRMPARLVADGVTQTGWVEGDLGELLLESGLGPWRLPRALPVTLDDPQRIRIEAAGGTIALEREAGRWLLREPVAIEAEADAVRSLIAALSRIRVQSFEPVAIVSALDAPWLRIEIERASPGGSGAALGAMLEVGSALDLAETAYAGRASAWQGGEPLIASRTLSLAADGLAGLSIAPEALVRRTLSGMPPGEVVRVALTTAGGAAATYTRTLGGWADGSGREVERPAKAAIDAILDFACITPADAIAFDTSEPLEPLGGIGLQLRRGESVLVQLFRGPGEGQIVAEVDGVRRSYSNEAALLEALTLVAP